MQVYSSNLDRAMDEDYPIYKNVVWFQNIADTVVFADKKSKGMIVTALRAKYGGDYAYCTLKPCSDDVDAKLGSRLYLEGDKAFDQNRPFLPKLELKSSIPKRMLERLSISNDNYLVFDGKYKVMASNYRIKPDSAGSQDEYFAGSKISTVH